MDSASGMIGSFWWWTIVQICQMEVFWLQEGAMLSHGAFGFWNVQEAQRAEVVEPLLIGTSFFGGK